MANISLPNLWTPRPYQFELWKYLENGGKRAVAVNHRRWGKDDVALNWTAVSAHQKTATYWHMLPEYKQARRAIWNAVDPHTGKRRIDQAFPPVIRKRTVDDEMLIEFTCGSTWQVVGSDSYNTLVGAPPFGIVFSEFSLADPAAWSYFQPILAENGGWALFIYTSRGKNHGHALYQSALKRPGWFASKQTVADTNVFTPEALEEARQDQIAIWGEDDGQALFDQEYFCSFEAAVIGAYYGKQIAELDKQSRITSVPHEKDLPVYTGWDLGIDDSTAVWFAQIAGREIRIIDYIEARGRALTDIARDVLAKPYAYADHYLPHDVDTREMTSARTRKETLEELGLRPIRAGSRLPVQDGINAARNMLSKCVFDAVKTEKGLNALRQYRSDWDSKNKTPRKQPLHDWSSHGADAFRELAVQLFDVVDAGKRKTIIAQGEWNPFEPMETWERNNRRDRNIVEEYNPF